ncbi:DUF3558 domain-containing protein [Mycobacteroides immunogenum]|uniref:DUF3558 domain-containing protein n=1 Tax=Mycobacteroides immunogenum TaxID=83262 RepID=UPI0009932471
MLRACSKTALLASAITAASVLAACTQATGGLAVRSSSNAASELQQSTASPTTVQNTLPAPHPPPDKHSDGTAFEPCTSFAREELQNWGVDPNKVDDVSIEMQNQIRGCRWWDGNRSWSLTIDVLNATVEKYLRPDPTLSLQQPVSIGGLSGAIYASANRDNCTVVLPSQKAVVFFDVYVSTGDQAHASMPDTCSKATAIATAVAGRLPQ